MYGHIIRPRRAHSICFSSALRSAPTFERWTSHSLVARGLVCLPPLVCCAFVSTVVHEWIAGGAALHTAPPRLGRGFQTTRATLREEGTTAGTAAGKHRRRARPQRRIGHAIQALTAVLLWAVAVVPAVWILPPAPVRCPLASDCVLPARSFDLLARQARNTHSAQRKADSAYSRGTLHILRRSNRVDTRARLDLHPPAPPVDYALLTPHRDHNSRDQPHSLTDSQSIGFGTRIITVLVSSPPVSLSRSPLPLAPNSALV